MAERRMFAKSIVLSDAFLDMPMSARCLYFTLGMLADDDGFVGNPKSIMRQCGATDDDIKVLLAKRYVLGFESGVIVIKHWRMNNYLQNDRKKETTYLEEKATLKLDEKGSYTELNKECIQNVYKMYTQDSIGKNSIGKNNNNTINSIVCTELSEDSSLPVEEPKYKMLLKHKNTYHPIYQTDIDHYQEFYPALDVEQQIRNMVMWCESHPSERKTQTGIKAFITRWLNKEQNRVGKPTDELKRRTQEAYIKDVEMKQKAEERKEQGGNWFD